MKRISKDSYIVLKNVFAAFVIKGGALLVSLFSTPLFISYFHDDRAVLGVWYTLLSVLNWFLTFDLGIGNGIRNKLVIALTQNDRLEAKKVISSGIFSNLVLAIALFAFGSVILGSSNLNQFFNISENTVSQSALLYSTMIVFSAIMIRFFLTSISAVFYAIQKSSVNNFLALCTSVLQLVFLFVFRFDTPSQALISVSVAYLVFSTVPILVAGVIVFMTGLKDCRPNIRFVDKAHIRCVLGIGGIFFLCQIMYMLLINTNEIFITKLFGSEFTSDYTFYFKISSLISSVVTLALTPMWSMVTKALEEKNYEWLKKLFALLKIVGLLSALVQFLAVPFLQFIMDIWLGKGVLQVSYTTALIFAALGSVYVYTGVLSTIVCGMAKMKNQVIMYSAGVVVKIGIILLGSRLSDNWCVVVIATVVALIPYCIVEHISLNRYFKKSTRVKGEKI